MDGILIIDKPRGITSHDVVDFVRRKFHIKKVGHAGTLDPLATGVLVILLGAFTKKSAALSSDNKKYLACLSLGVATDSLDSQGKVLAQENLGMLSLKQVELVFDQFKGEIQQMPPMFSALKYKGKKLYTLARKGIEVERSLRSVFIYELKITDFLLPNIFFEVKCSKGTYIRSLCADIAQKLGYPGHLSQLRRLSCGSFSISQAINLTELERLSSQELNSKVITQLDK